MRARRTVGTLLSLVMAVGALGLASTPAAAAATSLTVPAAIAGEQVVVAGHVPVATQKPRAVRLQTWSAGAWRTLRTATTTATGRFTFPLTQSSKPATLRVEAPRTSTRALVRTTSRRVVPLSQTATLRLPATASAGGSATATLAFSPVRAGRPLVVERRDGTRWTTVARATQGARGTATLRVAVGDAGDRTFRATATQHRGAASVTATARVLVVATPTPDPDPDPDPEPEPEPEPDPVPTGPDLVSARPDGTAASFPSRQGAADRTGRWVAFTSTAADLGVTNPEGHEAVWLRDTVRRTTTLVSRTRTGEVADGDSTDPSVSADGRYVVFGSDAADLVADDHDLEPDVFLLDRTTGQVELLSRRTRQTDEVDGRSFSPAISPNGRYVTYSSDDEGVTGQAWAQVMLHDRATGSTTLVSTGPDGPGQGGPSIGSRVADTGLVAFRSSSPRLTGRATSEVADLFLHAPGRSALRNVTRRGNAGGSGSFDLAGDGSRLVFQSQSWDLPGAQDDDDLSDVFLLELDGDVLRLLSTSDHPEAEHRYPAISDDGGTVTWLSLRDEVDGSRVLQMVAHDVRRGLERPVTSVLATNPSASTVWPLDVSGDGRVAVYRTRRPDLTGEPTGRYDQVVREAVPVLP